jgi:radical SAM protein with 4Fe4S-binding SPASM domain
MSRLQEFAETLVESTREYVYIRPEDGLLVLRPNRAHFLNRTATEMLARLYAGDAPDVQAIVRDTAQTYGIPEGRAESDLQRLLASVAALLNDDVCGAPAVRETRFGSHARELPVISEVALTYRCQNRCWFCYASSPDRGREVREMSTAEVCKVIDRIYDEAHCPTISFTGGEPTLREDLPELIAYAKGKGMRVNLITNGLRCADGAYVAGLAAAGLDSAQVSLEAGSAEVHDRIVAHPGAFALSTQAVHTLRSAGIHTHTNTTICAGNRDHLEELVTYIARELGSEYLSMNMVIRTGTALEHPGIGISYREIGPLISSAQAWARREGVRLVWYSPLPYCLFNPVQAGLGSKSCAAADGLLSVNPSGDVLPCSSFEQGLGNLLTHTFHQVWQGPAARYWRSKAFLPPECESCAIKHICCGACPLYWDERGGFAELEGLVPPASLLARLRWRLRRWHRASWGVGLRRSRDARCTHTLSPPNAGLPAKE